MWRCGAWILPVLVGLFCLVSRPFLQNQSVLRMRALIFLVLVFVFVYLRLGSYLYLSSKQTVNAHAPRWLMAFICHSDRATLISTAAVPSHLRARLVLPRPLDNHHPEGRYSCPKGVRGGGVGVCGSGFGAWGQEFQGFVWLWLFAGESVCIAIHDPGSGASPLFKWWSNQLLEFQECNLCLFILFDLLYVHLLFNISHLGFNLELV